MLKGVIVDDEVRNVETLRNIISQYCSKELTVVGSAYNITDAQEIILQTSPDVVFLDIEMPNGSGFDLLERFPKPPFEVIFTTGFGHYAINAIKFSALDYLLKPINIGELQEAIAKSAEKRKYQSSEETMKALINTIQNPKNKSNKIPLPILNGFQYVAINTIAYCHSDEDYTFVFLNDGQKLVVTKSIKDFEDLLSEYDFFRIHHSILINKSYIKKYVKGEGGTVVTEQNIELPVSRRRKAEFLEWLNNS